MIERLLILAMLQVVVTMVRRGLGDEAGTLDRAAALLDQSLREPVQGISRDRVAKLVRRAKRATEEAMAPLQDQLVGTQLLAVAYFASELTKAGILVVGAQSPFAQAWDEIADVLGCAWDDLNKDDRATVAAHSIAERLAGLGQGCSTLIR